MLEGLLREAPDDAAAGLLLATNHSKLGEIHLAASRREAALASFQQALGLIEPLAKRQPEQPDVLRLEGVSYYKLAEWDISVAKDEAHSTAERLARWQSARG